MSYRVRYTFPDGRTGHWMRNYATREGAQKAIDDRHGDTGLAYTVEEVPNVSTAAVPDASPDPTASQWLWKPAQKPTSTTEPVSTAAHHVEILRERVKELEALVEERGKAVTKAHAANFVMYRHLEFALCIGDAMRDAMRNGEWRSGHDRSMANSAIAGWDRWRPGLAASPQGTAKASEAPREGGDSDRRRLEALERYLEGDTFREVWKTSMGPFAAGTKIEGQHFDAPTLAALADKLAEMEAKP